MITQFLSVHLVNKGKLYIFTRVLLCLLTAKVKCMVVVLKITGHPHIITLRIEMSVGHFKLHNCSFTSASDT